MASYLLPGDAGTGPGHRAFADLAERFKDGLCIRAQGKYAIPEHGHARRDMLFFTGCKDFEDFFCCKTAVQGKLPGEPEKILRTFRGCVGKCGRNTAHQVHRTEK